MSMPAPWGEVRLNQGQERIKSLLEMSPAVTTEPVIGEISGWKNKLIGCGKKLVGSVGLPVEGRLYFQ